MLKIADKLIGDGQPCFIIAEAGANHNRNLDMAKELIDAAVEAGADAVKFQTYSAETLYSRKTPKFSYLKDQDVWQLIKAIELPREWQGYLADYCQKKGIIFLSTPFDFRAVDELAELNVPAYKIASFELVDLTLLRYTAQKGKPVIISTGMANLGDIEDAIKAIRQEHNDQIALLHCNSLYPTPAGVVNLKAIDNMGAAFGLPVGFSDHTLGITIPIAAVARGAKIIEKHYTLDRNLPGPDHPFALEPDELKNMVTAIREVEAALGHGRKERAPEEEEMYTKGRRSIIAAQDIPQGTVIIREMLTVKRPGYGIAPKYIDLVVGRTAKRDIETDEPITWNEI